VHKPPVSHPAGRRYRIKFSEIVILVRPSAKNKALFGPYEQEAGIEPIPGKGVVEKDSFEVVWGDATDDRGSYNPLLVSDVQIIGLAAPTRAVMIDLDVVTAGW
jgi:hypothetical protein